MKITEIKMIDGPPGGIGFYDKKVTSVTSCPSATIYGLDENGHATELAGWIYDKQDAQLIGNLLAAKYGVSFTLQNRG